MLMFYLYFILLLFNTFFEELFGNFIAMLVLTVGLIINYLKDD